ncbi:MAG: hypothetical protein ACO1OB_13600 [Archangium sp.]
MKQQRPGWSAARLLLMAAVGGIVGGVALAWSQSEPPDPEKLAEAEVDRILRAGRPMDSTDMNPDPRSLQGIPPYPGAAPRKLTSYGVLKDTPAVISWFQTEDPVEKVLDFYALEFKRANKVIALEQYSKDMGYVGWMEYQPDGGAGLLHMVSAMKQYRKTMVLLSASQPELLLENNSKLPGGLPLPDNASTPQVVKLGEGPLANDMAYSRVSNMTGQQVVDFYEKFFKDNRFEEIGTANEENRNTVSAQKDGQRVIVSARNEGSYLNLVITYIRQSPQEAMP